MTKFLTNRQAAEAYLAGKPLEFELSGVWYQSDTFNTSNFGLDARSQYRLARVTITQTVTYPKPVTEPLKVGEGYWVASPLKKPCSGAIIGKMLTWTTFGYHAA